MTKKNGILALFIFNFSIVLSKRIIDLIFNLNNFYLLIYNTVYIIKLYYKSNFINLY